MHLSSMIEIVESGLDDRVLLGSSDSLVTGSELGRLARAGASTLGGCAAVVYVGENHPMLPVALFAAAWAGVPFVPVTYRAEDAQMNALIERQPGALVLADASTVHRVSGAASEFGAWLRSLPADVPDVAPAFDDDAVAVVLYTSGTTSEPKSALLRHRHLMAYLLGSVEFASASDQEAVLVAVPGYHVAGIANMLSNTFAGRRVVYLESFEPSSWLAAVRRERITNAMVVPTMLARIVEFLDGAPADVPTLRTLSYGGSRISPRVLAEALTAFPTTGFVNAYGLTETTSTIAVLGPQDHRDAMGSTDAYVQRRLTSAGKVLPTIEIEIRGEDGTAMPPGCVGMIYLRGEQIAGEYSSGSVLDADGWFCTRDNGSIDADGYLYIEGRTDDTIIRGGENIAPAEIETALLSHPAVSDACVVGIPDDEWGQRIVAAVILREGEHATEEELRNLVRSQLRSSKTPESILFRDELPRTESGKPIRRLVLEVMISEIELR